MAAKAGVTWTCEGCGYTRTYRTEGHAKNGRHRHSCSTHRDRLARAAREEARRADPGVPAPCTHIDDGVERHPHGTSPRYTIDKCRCRACRDVTAAHQRWRNRQKAYGKPSSRLIDAEPTRAHIDALREQGMGLSRIADLSGVHHSVVRKLTYGVPSKGKPANARVTRAVAAKILAVGPDLAGSALVDPCGAALRMRALVAIGWTQKELSEQLGLSRVNSARLFLDSPGLIKAGTYAAALRVYERLWDTPPADTWQARRSVERARLAGWCRPMELDDDLLDTPGYAPVRGESRERGIYVWDVEFLIGVGLSRSEVAGRLGVRTDSVRNALARAGRQDLLVALARNSGDEVVPA